MKFRIWTVTALLVISVCIVHCARPAVSPLCQTPHGFNRFCSSQGNAVLDARLSPAEFKIKPDDSSTARTMGSATDGFAVMQLRGGGSAGFSLSLLSDIPLKFFGYALLSTFTTNFFAALWFGPLLFASPFMNAVLELRNEQNFDTVVKKSYSMNTCFSISFAVTYATNFGVFILLKALVVQSLSQALALGTFLWMFFKFTEIENGIWIGHPLSLIAIHEGKGLLTTLFQFGFIFACLGK